MGEEEFVVIYEALRGNKFPLDFHRYFILCLFKWSSILFILKCCPQFCQDFANHQTFRVMHYALQFALCIDSPLIMFWNMDFSRLHFIWAITLIRKYTWFNYSSEKSWKIPSCGWLIASYHNPTNLILRNSFPHGDLGNSSQFSHLGNQYIWYTS